MVIYYLICFAVVSLIQILFMMYAVTHEAKGDKDFLAIQIIAIVIIINTGLNMLYQHFGDTGFLLSKISLSSAAAFFVIQFGIFVRIKVDNFSNNSKYTLLVDFIVTILVIVSCSIAFMNIFNEKFFIYCKTPVIPYFFRNIFNDDFEYITSFKTGPLWSIYLIAWFSLIFIYGLLNFTRIIMRSLINSIHEVIINLIFIIQIIAFIILKETPARLCFYIASFCFLLPILYFLMIHKDKAILQRLPLRSRVFDFSSAIYVIFNADDLLVDFNPAAQKFFGFSEKDIFKLSIADFVKEYVPIGTVPDDDLSIEQIYVNGKNENRSVCQLDFHRITYFKKVSICSFFVIRDISEIVRLYTDIQQSSMTDNLTGLLAQHVLIRKMREINMYRLFPYTVASCSVHIPNEAQKSVNTSIALIHVAECIRSKIRGTDFASYENGNIVLLFPAEMDVAQNVMNRIVAAINEDNSLGFHVEFEYGLSSRETPDTDIQETLSKAHSVMFKQGIEKSIRISLGTK